jgi:hypothetical protein
MHEEECTTCNLEKRLQEASKDIEGATWEYPAYLSIPSPTFRYVNFGIQYDGENTYELIGNDEEGATGGAITLTGNETAKELKALSLELFKTIHELHATEGKK